MTATCWYGMNPRDMVCVCLCVCLCVCVCVCLCVCVCVCLCCAEVGDPVCQNGLLWIRGGKFWKRCAWVVLGFTSVGCWVEIVLVG